MKRRSWVGVAGVFLLVSVVGMPSLAASQVPVVVDGEKIHAEVQGAELREVLKALADKAGLRIVVAGSASEVVALRWKGISVQEAVRDLLRNRDHILVYKSTSGGPILAEVWVLGDQDKRLTKFAGQEMAGVKGEEATEGSGTAALDELMQLTADLQQKGNVARLIDLLRERIYDLDPQIQKFAFSALARVSDPRATEILAAVIRDDPDPDRRRMAASALRKRRGAESVAFLARAAREDPDFQVRREFLAILGRMGEVALPALSQAASDPDPDVAETAQRMVKRVEEGDGPAMTGSLGP